MVVVGVPKTIVWWMDPTRTNDRCHQLPCLVVLVVVTMSAWWLCDSLGWTRTVETVGAVVVVDAVLEGNVAWTMIVSAVLG